MENYLRQMVSHHASWLFQVLGIIRRGHVWHAPDGTFPVVHLGSEGDAIYVLAPSPLDFLRLLAIGYHEIGFADLASPPTEEEREESVNPAFQSWVTEIRKGSLPETGAEIVESDASKHAALQEWINERCR